MDGREDRYNWTQSYLDSNLAVLVAENSQDKSVEGFQGPGGVAVRAGSSAAFGIHTTETGEFSFEKVYYLADQAMYRDKKKSRR